MKLPTTSKDKRKGFTLVEVVIVISIIALLFAIGSLVDSGMYQRRLISAEQAVAISVLQKARNQAMNNMYASEYGVHIDPDAYVLFRGPSYVPNDPNNETIPKNSHISISGLRDIVFAQLSGEPNNPGQIILDDGTQQKYINIKRGGLID